MAYVSVGLMALTPEQMETLRRSLATPIVRTEYTPGVAYTVAPAAAVTVAPLPTVTAVAPTPPAVLPTVTAVAPTPPVARPAATVRAPIVIKLPKRRPLIAMSPAPKVSPEFTEMAVKMAEPEKKFPVLLVAGGVALAAVWYFLGRKR